MSSAVAESPLASRHAALGARMIPFAGWNLPVEYSGLLSEHKATRQAAGLFDISHMGQIHALGAGALSALETLLANDAAKLKDGEGHYTFFLNDQGGVIDDLFLYRISAEDFLLVVNASRHREVLQLLKPKETPQVHFRGQPGTTVGMALQGPKAAAILQKVLHADSAKIPARNHLASFQIEGGQVWIARTGYTGEDGFELFSDLITGPKIWDRLLEAGHAEGLLPCGLGSRDSLRTEAGFPLNGQDLTPQISPVEAGLAFFVDISRPRSFPGRSVVEPQKKGNLSRICIGLQGQPGQPPPRHDYPVFLGGKPIGKITSGVPSPTLGHGIALALVTTPPPACGQEVEFEVRGRKVPAKVSLRKFLPKK